MIWHHAPGSREVVNLDLGYITMTILSLRPGGGVLPFQSATRAPWREIKKFRVTNRELLNNLSNKRNVFIGKFPLPQIKIYHGKCMVYHGVLKQVNHSRP